MGFLLADREKKQLEAKGIEVPKNFTATQGMLFGAFRNPHVANFVLQNEVQKRDSVISPVAQKQLETAVTERNDALSAKNIAVTERDDAVSAKNTAISEKETAIAEKNAAVSEKEAAVAAKNTADASLASLRNNINTFLTEWENDANIDISNLKTKYKNAFATELPNGGIKGKK